jgi:hypothetical protein
MKTITHKEMMEIPLNKGKNSLSPLKEYKNKIYSQNGEDGIIQHLFEKIGTTNKVCVEFGAGNGVRLSNTKHLREKGWSAYLFDCKYNKPEMNLHKEFITADNINDIFAKHNVPKEFDFLSLDIDGNDYWVWSKLEYVPRIAVVEINASLPFSPPLTIEYNEDHKFAKDGYFGMNLLAAYRLALKKDFYFLDLVDNNAYFAHKDVFDLLDLSYVEEHDLFKYNEFNFHHRKRAKLNKSNKNWVILEQNWIL